MAGLKACTHSHRTNPLFRNSGPVDGASTFSFSYNFQADNRLYSIQAGDTDKLARRLHTTSGELTDEVSDNVEDKESRLDRVLGRENRADLDGFLRTSVCKDNLLGFCCSL